MRLYTTVVRGASPGVIQGRHHTAAHTQEKARGFLRRRTHTPYGASCRHHMFYKNPREEGRRIIWQALTFPFLLQKIHPPSKCQDALYSQFRSKAQIYHGNYIKHAWIPGVVSICCFFISWQTFALHFLIILHIVWFVRTHNWEAIWHKSNTWLLSAVGMGTPGIYSRCFNHRLGTDILKLGGRKVQASEPPSCWQKTVSK